MTSLESFGINNLPEVHCLALFQLTDQEIDESHPADLSRRHQEIGLFLSSAMASVLNHGMSHARIRQDVNLFPHSCFR